MTKHGFYSIVQKKPGEFHIRARVRKDLENLIERVPISGAKSYAFLPMPFELADLRETLRSVLGREFSGGATTVRRTAAWMVC